MTRFLPILLLLSSTTLLPQSLKETADDHFNHAKYELALKDYQKYLKHNSKDSSAWYNLGMSAMNLKDYSHAIEYLKKAQENHFPPSFTSYNIAKAYVLNNNEEMAIKTLQSGADNGTVAYKRISTDGAFDKIKNQEGFKKALEKIRLNAYPCLQDEKRRHFDFWIGEWDVYARGQKVGENSITLADGGCVIHESYTTAGNYSGQSMNYYDPIDEKWHQHWVGAAGDTYNYIETDKDDGMLQFESKFMNIQGKISISRMTFTHNDDGTVRQLMESSNDYGKTWQVAFDGLYKPKAQ
ncbi:tetratricopeptide repeat protein [Fulvivirga sp. 29W222]|uniref:Tetratricopeptide repeat protein n=1 Tax=Fulvivirga marina TaxID=2494733 RepID=A0A937KDS0_9BACT|nr:tetratricopeptide repeat protein [Fulvivirga marina]MBL6449416.1 tetratricopeptide repeat protein [Fulvivirga marina]